MRIDPTSFQAALALERGRVILPSGDFAVPMFQRSPGGRIRNWDGTCAVISAEDKDDLGQFNWCCDRLGYVRRRTPGGGMERMHRRIMGLGPGIRGGAHLGDVVDHINGDPLDNRRENLRVCTQAQNAQNKRSLVGSASSYRGVSFDATNRPGKPWEAHGKTNGRKVHLGRYATEEEAAKAASQWRRENLSHSIEGDTE